ncbi:serine hydroxymethyltransferase [Facklamia sp. P12934]|uniref:serine hydroxymethyltransferase n=1 Tax=unclassified Facklamia TaxID=2622293 RepID=UPI003D17BA1F
MLNKTKVSDPKLYEIVIDELKRQEKNIEMIASESTVPIEIMELSGSIFTNKTLEGYPGKRYQQGAQCADVLEIEAIERAKELFKCEHVNIQPYSGTTANYSVYAAVLEPGDTVLSMKLDQGGHLSHGSKANFMNKFYNFVHYPLNNENEQVDYSELERLAVRHQPKLIIAGGSAYPRLLDYEKFRAIADKVNAYLMVDAAHIIGLIAAKVIPSPVPYADFITASTTKTFSGPRSGIILCKKEHAKKIDHGVFPAALGSMHLTTMAAKCWLFKHCQSQEYQTLMQQVVKNSKTLAKALENKGFRLVANGSDTHLLLVDLRQKNITGKQMDEALNKIGITVNKNQIPSDPLGPNETSGIRIGTMATTQRGMKEDEMLFIAELMNKTAECLINEKSFESLKKQVRELVNQFPLYSKEEIEYIVGK